MAGGGYERGDNYIPNGIQRAPYMAPSPLPSRGDFPKDEAANPGMSRMFWPISGAIHPFQQSVLLSNPFFKGVLTWSLLNPRLGDVDLCTARYLTFVFHRRLVYRPSPSLVVISHRSSSSFLSFSPAFRSASMWPLDRTSKNAKILSAPSPPFYKHCWGSLIIQRSGMSIRSWRRSSSLPTSPLARVPPQNPNPKP